MLATTRDSPPKLSATAAVKNNSIIDFQTAQNKILKNGRMQKRRRSLATNAELYRNEFDEDFIEAKLAKLGAKIYNRVGANLDGTIFPPIPNLLILYAIFREFLH